MWIVEDLENAINIVELVSKYTNIKKAWVNYKALCPFPWHSEKTPSFVISPSKQLAYCFGCHKWWWSLKFIMDIENCDFKEAIEILWNFTWIKINTNFNKKEFEVKKSIYSLYKTAINYYKKALENNFNIKKYLLDRWIKEQTIKNFHFWYSDSWLNLYNYLKNKWYEKNIINQSKIFVDINSKKDKFINRIIFPIQNQRGDFVALAWRIVWKGEPKYLNSPASKIYDKSSILYWLYSARNNITKKNYVIITEWYMDTISLHEANFFNTVSVSWTALTEKHIQILKKLTNKMYLCFDWDNAWEKATKLSLELLKNKWLEIKIILLPNWKDPDDVIKSWKDFWKYIENALTPIWYYIKKSNFNINSIDEKRKLLDILLNIINSYSDQIEKEFYIKEISKLLDISERIIYDKLNRFFLKKEIKIWEHKKIDFSITDISIWYILKHNKLLKIFNKKIIFKKEVDFNLIACLEKPKDFIQSLELSKKEKYRAIILMIENNKENQQAIQNKIENLIKKINKDSYNKITNRLKERMKKDDINAFKKYSEIIKIAKKEKII